MVLNSKIAKRSYAILYLTVLMFNGCINVPLGEDYLLPQGFKGRATVIFNQKNGLSEKYKDGRRVYEIPSNGILLTQFKPVYGIIDHHYYMDSNGRKQTLPIYDHNQDGITRLLIKDSTQTGVFLDGTVGQYAGNDDAPFQLFIVSPPNKLNSIESDNNFNKRINKLIGTNL